MNTPEICHDERRRREVRKQNWNGIDYLEVSPDQLTLTVYFLGKAPRDITVDNIRIDGGLRVRGIRVLRIRLCVLDDPDLDDCMQVTVDRPGDFSTYTLRLVEPDPRGGPGTAVLHGFDPRYAQIAFSFKVDCPSDLDCAPVDTCVPPALPEPEISYLAKDYASFRQLILDRLALIMPGWQERHVPDIGIALVEVLAYTGDYLSYYQDAVGTEAYLQTARQRISVRRHARLVDYFLHEGCNARTWASIETDTPETLDPAEVYFITGLDSALLPADTPVLKADDLRNIPPSLYEVFEPVRELPIELDPNHNQISFYTWGNRECCLPRGATSATMRDGWLPEPVPAPGPAPTPARVPEPGPPPGPDSAQARALAAPGPSGGRRLHVQAGDVLIFEEVLGPKTGVAADADITHRHAVRLTEVEPAMDELYDQPIVNITWAVEDALPFPLCLSVQGPPPGCAFVDDVSVARGNVILVDHGRTVDPEFWIVPQPPEENVGCEDPCAPLPLERQAARFRPTLAHDPLTYRTPFPAPAVIAQRQADLLGRIMDRVRSWVRRLWDRARAGQGLTPADLEELQTLFGARVLVEVGLLPPPTTRDPVPVGPAEQAAALERLIAGEDRWLADTSRRLEVLRTRALGGALLDAADRLEVVALVGARFAAGLAGTSAQMLGPARGALAQDPRAALPDMRLQETRAGQIPAPAIAEFVAAAPYGGEAPPTRPGIWWVPRFDLLASSGDDRHFVVEMDDRRHAHLRFGDGEVGRAPQPGVRLQATYRVGNGQAGNIGADALAYIVHRRIAETGAGMRVRNPLPAQGGTEPEPLPEAKLFAPGAFRKDLQRAITAADYARLAERDPRVQRAAATLEWMGSWYTVRVAIDPLGGEEAGARLLADIAGVLYRYRRIGHDLQVAPASYVSLDIAMTICVLPHFLRGHVEAALRDVFSNRTLPNGRQGFFHPDQLSFGGSIYLSKLVALAQAVPGVENVQITRLQRLYAPPNKELENGVLPIGLLEIAQLDNDPSFPEHGKLTLTLRGGR